MENRHRGSLYWRFLINFMKLEEVCDDFRKKKMIVFLTSRRFLTNFETSELAFIHVISIKFPEKKEQINFNGI